MTEKRFKVYSDSYSADIVDEDTNKNYNQLDDIDDICDLLNEQHETIKTLGIAIAKILQAIKDDRENHAMIMCIEVLKKLEENGVDLE